MLNLEGTEGRVFSVTFLDWQVCRPVALSCSDLFASLCLNVLTFSFLWVKPVWVVELFPAAVVNVEMLSVDLTPQQPTSLFKIKQRSEEQSFHFHPYTLQWVPTVTSWMLLLSDTACVICCLATLVSASAPHANEPTQTSLVVELWQRLWFVDSWFPLLKEQCLNL